MHHRVSAWREAVGRVGGSADAASQALERDRHAWKEEWQHAVNTAFANGHEDVCVQLLVHAAAPVNADEALQAAAACGLIPAVDRLLAQGANPQADQSAALHLACEHGQAQAAARLLPLSHPDDRPRALSLALENGEMTVVEVLVPTVSADSLDSRAWCLAALNGHQDVLDRMLPAGNPEQVGVAMEFLGARGQWAAADRLGAGMSVETLSTLPAVQQGRLPMTQARIAAARLSEALPAPPPATAPPAPRQRF